MWAPALRCAPSRPALRRGTHPNSSKLPSLMTRRAFTSGCRKFWTVHTRQKPRSAPSVGRTRARPGLPCGAGAFRIPLGLAAGAPPQSVTGGAGKARQTRLSSHADRRCVTASKLCIYLPPVASAGLVAGCRRQALAQQRGTTGGACPRGPAPPAAEPQPATLPTHASSLPGQVQDTLRGKVTPLLKQAPDSTKATCVRRALRSGDREGPR